MAKAGRWLRSLIVGRKGKHPPPSPAEAHPPTLKPPKEKKRWSFRGSSRAPRGQGSTEPERTREAAAVAAEAVDAPAVALPPSTVEDAAAIKIQAMYRAHLARKALKALKGIVKLQALIKGQLVRKQATATLRCVQALVAAQCRARMRRIRMSSEDATIHTRRPSIQNRSPSPSPSPSAAQHKHRFGRSHDAEEKAATKVGSIVEHCKDSSSKGRIHGAPQHSPAPSTLTEISPRTCSGHFDEPTFRTTQSSPHYYSVFPKLPCYPLQEDAHSVSNDCTFFFPNYMANTESSRAKSRSQSVPRQRVDLWERQPWRRKPPPVEQRSTDTPRGAYNIQRSSSNSGSRSNMSTMISECGSRNSFVSSAINCRSLVPFVGY